MANRVSQQVVEVVSRGSHLARVTQQSMEVAVPSPISPQRFSQALVEVVAQISHNSCVERLTQALVEVIATRNITARPTQALVEIVTGTSGVIPRDTPRQWRLHKFDMKKRTEQTS